jgi:hypothetical protein
MSDVNPRQRAEIVSNIHIEYVRPAFAELTLTQPYLTTALFSVLTAVEDDEHFGGCTGIIRLPSGDVNEVRNTFMGRMINTFVHRFVIHKYGTFKVMQVK